MRRGVLRSASLVLALGAVAALQPLAGCAAPKPKGGPGMRLVRDERISRKQLEELSNAFADRYFTLMLSASERVMRDNPDLQQCRLMNGLRLLGVSSMYDIATTPDTLTQLVDQYVVVTLQNYFWVDSGRANLIWKERSRPIEENLRRAREDITALCERVFTDEQLLELDLQVSTWWSTRSGADFVAYVRFSEVASSKGQDLIEKVRDGGGLLEPLDRATEQLVEAQFAYDRSFFWAKRLPLFANWQILAMWYDIMVMPDVRRALDGVDRVTTVVGSLPTLLEQQGPVVQGLLQEYQRAMQATSGTLERAQPLVEAVSGVMQASGGTIGKVNETLDKVAAMQARAEAAKDPNAPPAKPMDIAEVTALLAETRSTLTEANRALESGDRLLGSTAIDQRLATVQAASDALIDKVFWRAMAVVGALIGGLVLVTVIRTRRGGA
ncbi:MAG: hypothetical protein RJA05_1330 [Planctomycetota bacterium]